MNVIQCYAQTCESGETIKELLFHRLLEILEKYSMNDLNVLMGEFNAEIWSNNYGREGRKECQRLRERNEKGAELLDLCASANFLTGASLFSSQENS